MSRRAKQLVDVGLATAKDGNMHISSRVVAILERRELDRVGQQMARERGLIYTPSKAGEYVSGRLNGVASLVSGRFATIENGLGFQLLPWHPSWTNTSASTSAAFSGTTAASNGSWEGVEDRACSTALGRVGSRKIERHIGVHAHFHDKFADAGATFARCRGEATLHMLHHSAAPRSPSRVPGVGHIDTRNCGTERGQRSDQ
ncbi:MAG: DUF3363 domain-containing protein [Bradyrhizobium sp.]|nr:DUF3363 domain-containing protein [Bradyrhizobium sp.]